MSYVEVFKVKTNGDVEEYGEAQNSHGYAHLVWMALGEKYLGGFSLLNASLTWNLFDSDKITKDEKIILGSTFDRVWIKKELMPDLIRILHDFYYSHCREKVGTMLVVHGILSEMLLEKDTMGCAFNQSSIGEAFWEVYDADSEDEGCTPYNVLTNDGDKNNKKAWELSKDLI